MKQLDAYAYLIVLFIKSLWIHTVVFKNWKLQNCRLPGTGPPSFILSKRYSTVKITDLKKAIHATRNGLPGGCATLHPRLFFLRYASPPALLFVVTVA